jgi:FkbM family methyltransferase
VVIDCGANIGLFSLYCLAKFQRCTVLAVEPIPAAHALLERNASGRACSQGQAVIIERCGVGERPEASATFLYSIAKSAESHRRCFAQEARAQRSILGELGDDALGDGGDGEGHVEERGSSGGGAPVGIGRAGGELLQQCTAPIFTISELMARHGVAHAGLNQRVDLLKIDVEGAELAALQGIAEADWPKISQITLEVHDVDGRLDAVLSLLRGHGYRLRVRSASSSLSGDGYLSMLPMALRLFYVYASRLCVS